MAAYDEEDDWNARLYRSTWFLVDEYIRTRDKGHDVSDHTSRLLEFIESRYVHEIAAMTSMIGMLAETGDMQFTRLLFEKGMPADYPIPRKEEDNPLCCTRTGPLHGAILDRKPELVRLLLDNGALVSRLPKKLLFSKGDFYRGPPWNQVFRRVLAMSSGWSREDDYDERVENGRILAGLVCTNLHSREYGVDNPALHEAFFEMVVYAWFGEIWPVDCADVFRGIAANLRQMHRAILDLEKSREYGYGLVVIAHPLNADTRASFGWITVAADKFERAADSAGN